MPISKNKIFSKPILKNSKEKPQYFLTRFVLLRALAFVYLFAFLSLATQVIPLIGHDGLLPAHNYLSAVNSHFDNKFHAFLKLPTIFWINDSDSILIFMAWTGVILSLIVLFGFSNAPLLFILWIIYLSFVNIGQLFYSYGWEIQLLETGFLAIFLCPLWNMNPFSKSKVSAPVMWLFRWLAFRIYLGSGLIKIRGDSCWRDLACLYYHYETQPIPNPISRFAYFMPQWFHRLGVVWNHFIELVVPFFIFYPRIARYAAGILLISFQFILILSGNLSFLNWVTIIPCIACFDDTFFKKILPNWIVSKAEFASRHQVQFKLQPIIAWILVLIVAFLSIPVVQNLFSSNQAMNTSYNELYLVNTYGAFGSIGRERYELIIEGTADDTITSQTLWKEYEFKYKPGDIYRKLPVIAPYQPRIDWQIWFAAMERPEQNPWLIHMIWKLMDNDKSALSLLADNPFPNTPPKFIRIEYYHYKFTKPGDKSGAIWSRTYAGEWLQPVSKSTPGLKNYLKAYGWEN